MTPPNDHHQLDRCFSTHLAPAVPPDLVPTLTRSSTRLSRPPTLVAAGARAVRYVCTGSDDQHCRMFPIYPEDPIYPDRAGSTRRAGDPKKKPGEIMARMRSFRDVQVVKMVCLGEGRYNHGIYHAFFGFPIKNPRCFSSIHLWSFDSFCQNEPLRPLRVRMSHLGHFE